MMAVAFVVGQFASGFVEPGLPNGAWPMVAPMLLAGAVIVAIAFLWLPRLHHQQRSPVASAAKKETP